MTMAIAKRVLFSGLGNMGFPMARNLKRKSNFEVFAFDIADKRIKMAEEEVC